ncbi:precorrin-6A synthase (deacetylating) [Pseudomonas typographi]|uniref:Precorrin-6A synthase (Deacetylating) n=1 Tax=Pseudomonas typographi TaxID=2715964 RepID=A0ABR7Z1K3_9PSED|nr:precorrin-6A synthase (deacetylating) [Pseudomonas typographi]MBD1599350.1 precorrin-6A synthase (deacetylating) [Pseudomonas typographi]
MKTLLIIGIGAGNPEHLTVQAIHALNRTDVFFLLDKGSAKQKLMHLRRAICERYIDHRRYRFVEAASPERDRGGDYTASVHALNQAKQRLLERLLDEQLADGECGALLVWGDPSLYDSTLRIVQAIAAGGRELEYEVIPGISSIQALAASHKVALNRIGGPVEITTGRRLAQGQANTAGSVVVMLDGENAYQHLQAPDEHIYWGAYLGTEDEILIAGKLADVAEQIEQVRQAARRANGWIMDTYLLQPPPGDED